MLIRISLIVALLAGLAAGGLGLVKVRQQALDMVAARDDFHKKADQELAAKTKALGELKKTKADLDQTKSTLDTTKTQLTQANTKAVAQQKRADELEGKLTQTIADRDSAQQRVASWEAFGLTPVQMKDTIDLLKKTEKQRDAYVGENKILLRKNTEVMAKLESLLGHNEEVKLPDGLKGKIVAVDPKYDFVVLNIGANEGVLERGKLLVNRNGKLVGKVQIVSVEPERCIANLIPDFRGGDLMEGDEVFY